ncbi:MAG: transketolase [Ferrimicrobium sp.]
MTEEIEKLRDQGAVRPPDIYDQSVNALRFLAVDAVNLANSGHPGTPLDVAPVIYRLFTRVLRHSPSNPDWPDRDRFILSGGHASMVLYGALYLSGYDVTLDDIRTFRRLGSRCAGHPERGLLPGVEVTTGPLGQGLANGVGCALAERMLATRFNRLGHSVVDHRTWVVCGDGDMMEGVTHEASALAGHLGLGKLVVLYDDNRVTLDGPTSLSFSEDVATRYLGYGWRVLQLFDVDDFSEVDAVLAQASMPSDRPTLVVMHTHIGIGTPLHDDHRVHGAALGAENTEVARDLLHWPYPPFVVPDEAIADWRRSNDASATAVKLWESTVDALDHDDPELGERFRRQLAGEMPPDWRAAIPSFTAGTSMSTRVAGGKVLRALAERIPELVGGAADVEGSTETKLEGVVRRGDYAGRDIYFGIREHAMAAMVNGIAAHGGLIPFGSTFFIFSDYLKPALRLAAVMELRAIFVFTHDSIGLGEDGTTHQPIEQLAGLRAMPGLVVVRPADANETAAAWEYALERNGPTALVLSRQNLGVLDTGVINLAGYVVAPGDEGTIVSTGSEVEIALEARAALAERGRRVRVVSVPSLELLMALPKAEREQLLGGGVPRVGVEAASAFGWGGIVDAMVAMEGFGASGRKDELFAHFGITAQAVEERMMALWADSAIP